MDAEPVLVGVDPAPAAEADRVGSGLSLPGSIVVCEGVDAPWDVGPGAGVPMSVPDGKGGMLWTPAIIC